MHSPRNQKLYLLFLGQTRRFAASRQISIHVTSYSSPGKMVASLHEIVAMNQHNFAHPPIVVRRAIERAIRHGLFMIINTQARTCAV